MTRAEKARELFLAGYNCAQAVVLAFADLTASNAVTLERASIGLGGGVGRMRNVCGTGSGAAMALGLIFPTKGKSEIYALVQRHAEAFRQRNGSIVCAELLAGAGVAHDASPDAEARTAAYYKKRPCPDPVADSAEILEDILRAEGKL